MKKLGLIVGGLFALLVSCGVGSAIAGSDTTTVASDKPAATKTVTVTESAAAVPAQPAPTVTATATVTATVKPEPAETKTKPAPKPAPKPSNSGSLTSAQENAVGSATDYLDTDAFSRKGLIEQLEYEDFSTKDATLAVDSLTVNYKEQAAQSAKDYLDTDHFSHQGLVEQLEYEGYSAEQSEYGVRKAGL